MPAIIVRGLRNDDGSLVSHVYNIYNYSELDGCRRVLHQKENAIMPILISIEDMYESVLFKESVDDVKIDEEDEVDRLCLKQVNSEIDALEKYSDIERVSEALIILLKNRRNFHLARDYIRFVDLSFNFLPCNVFSVKDTQNPAFFAMLFHTNKIISEQKEDENELEIYSTVNCMIRESIGRMAKEKSPLLNKYELLYYLRDLDLICKKDIEGMYLEIYRQNVYTSQHFFVSRKYFLFNSLVESMKNLIYGSLEDGNQKEIQISENERKKLLNIYIILMHGKILDGYKTKYLDPSVISVLRENIKVIKGIIDSGTSKARREDAYNVYLLINLIICGEFDNFSDIYKKYSIVNANPITSLSKIGELFYNLHSSNKISVKDFLSDDRFKKYLYFSSRHDFNSYAICNKIEEIKDSLNNDGEESYISPINSRFFSLLSFNQLAELDKFEFLGLVCRDRLSDRNKCLSYILSLKVFTKKGDTKNIAMYMSFHFILESKMSILLESIHKSYNNKRNILDEKKDILLLKTNSIRDLTKHSSPFPLGSFKYLRRKFSNGVEIPDFIEYIIKGKRVMSVDGSFILDFVRDLIIRVGIHDILQSDDTLDIVEEICTYIKNNETDNDRLLNHCLPIMVYQFVRTFIVNEEDPVNSCIKFSKDLFMNLEIDDDIMLYLKSMRNKESKSYLKDFIGSSVDIHLYARIPFKFPCSILLYLIKINSKVLK